MAQEAHKSEHEETATKSSARGRSAGDGHGQSEATMTSFFQTLDPQKMFPFGQMKKGDFGPLVEANLEMMRAFDGMFQSWAAGFSSRNQERIHTLEECVKCDSQADLMKLQNDCMQRLTKHWMADNQKLGGIFFDAVGKAVKENNSWMSSAMKKVTKGTKTT